MATYRKDIRPDTYVSCPTCGCEIIMLNTMSLPGADFRCDARIARDENFTKRMGFMITVTTPEKAQSSGKIQFGIRRTNERDQTSAKPMQPKSRFNAMATWLLH